MRIFKTKWFRRFARKEKITDKQLCEAIERIEKGLIDADLGDVPSNSDRTDGKLIKQRIARPNEGRSGGYRTVIFFKVEERSFFVFGFAKSDQDNLSPGELTDFKDMAPDFFGMDDDEITGQIDDKRLFEVICDDTDN